MQLNRELETAKCAAIKAGKKILEIYQRDFEITYKKDESPLTEADKASNALIVNALNAAFPQHAILAEESKDDHARMHNDWCWIVDPLDGTKEFIKRNGEFTVNIALTYKKQPVLGVIYIPVQQELYYAVEGEGAYHQRIKDSAQRTTTKQQSPESLSNLSTRIHVSDKTEALILVGSKSHASEELKKLVEANKEKIAETVSIGSSMKGCLIAKGEADIYYRFGLTSEWDTAAMQCIVEEAGGIFRQMDGTAMLYNRADNLNRSGFYIVNRIENIMV